MWSSENHLHWCKQKKATLSVENFKMVIYRITNINQYIDTNLASIAKTLDFLPFMIPK